jgi:beta-lactamase regulating signal transducer with metallopeptidase domain
VIALAASAETLWRATFWVLVHGTVLAALAYVLSRTVLRGARPAVIAALWTLVLVKFVVPVGPAMPWSLSSLIDRAVGGEAETIVVSAPVMHGTAEATAATTPTLSTTGAIALGAAALWALAVVVLLARRVNEQRRLRRRARAGALAGQEVTALVAAAARRLGLGRTPEIRVDDSTSPWVIGLGRAILVLPATMVAGNKAELTAVVAHELAHLRRRDAWLRIVQVIAGSLFFFWPVVRWANRRADAARELACDAWAIERGPLAATDYARVLVRLVRARGAAPEAALALAAHPAQLGARVDALLRRGGPRAGLGKAGAALLAAWALLALGGASRAEARVVTPRIVCSFTPQLAAEMLVAFPEADADGDGHLTRDEACEFQLELSIIASELAETSPMAEDTLCCNCGEIEATSSVLRFDPTIPAADSAARACPQE